MLIRTNSKNYLQQNRFIFPIKFISQIRIQTVRKFPVTTSGEQKINQSGIQPKTLEKSQGVSNLHGYRKKNMTNDPFDSLCDLYKTPIFEKK